MIAAGSAAVSAAVSWRTRRRRHAIVVSTMSTVAIGRSGLAQGVAAHRRITHFFHGRKHNKTLVPNENVNRRLVTHVNERNAERLLKAALNTGMHRQWWCCRQSKDGSAMTLRPEECPAIIDRRRNRTMVLSIGDEQTAMLQVYARRPLMAQRKPIVPLHVVELGEHLVQEVLFVTTQPNKDRLQLGESSFPRHRKDVLKGSAHQDAAAPTPASDAPNNSV